MMTPHHRVLHLIKTWLPLAFGLTVMAGLIYVTVQQNYRQGANDPQIQLAEDIGAAVVGGADPTAFVAGGSLDMSKSLSSWLIVYDKDSKVVASNVQLGGKTPAVPTGVLAEARKNGQDRITWQPQDGVRAAIVVEPVGSTGQVVVVGRSLREVEIRENQLMTMVIGGWAIALLGTLIINSLSMMLWPKMMMKMASATPAPSEPIAKA